jgi:GDP-L-fucose synthase
LYVDDLADACLFLMKHYDESEIINIGWGKDQTINELAEIIAGIVGFKGSIKWDSDKPDGTPRKLLDVSRLNKLGWRAKIELHSGIRQVYRYYMENIS